MLPLSTIMLVNPKNMLVVSGARLLWVDFDDAMTFNNMGPSEKTHYDHETALFESFGEALVCTAHMFAYYATANKTIARMMTRDKVFQQIQNSTK